MYVDGEGQQQLGIIVNYPAFINDKIVVYVSTTLGVTLDFRIHRLLKKQFGQRSTLFDVNCLKDTGVYC